MDHQDIFTYALAKYNIALGADEVIKIVSDNLNVDQYIAVNYPNTDL
tara:strand:+ start:3685 stop:3825 length:141 start_codon:yes stop_codon:yes gene_type:complete